MFVLSLAVVMRTSFLTVFWGPAKGLFLIKLTFIFLALGDSIGRSALAQSDAPNEISLPSLPAQSNSLELYSPLVDSAVEESYILGVGDYLRVDVFNIPDYSGEFRILSSGYLNIPIVGAIDIDGLSLQQAKAQIERSLGPYVRRPVVTLSVLETRPIQIAVSGEVNRPGSYRISLENNANDSTADIPTLTQAIKLAGGITQLANIRQIEVQRYLPRSSNSSLSGATLAASFRSKQNDVQTVSVNLWNLLKEGDLSEDLQLQDGDRIVIPTASNLDSDEIAQLATASFSPDEISVNVVGEVDSPGNIRVPPNTPLNQAILAAGGFNNRARRGTVSLVRLNLNGTVSQRDIEVDFSQGINEETNPSLRPNDTVIVKRSGLASAGDTFGAVFSPLNFIFRLFGI